MLETDAPFAQAQPWFAVALVVRSTDTTSEAITACLGAAPTTTKRRGEPISQRNPASPLRTENLWILKAPNLVAESLDEVVEVLLRTVPATPALPADCSMELSIGLNARPMGNLVGIGGTVIRRLAVLGASVVLDVYDGDPA